MLLKNGYERVLKAPIVHTNVPRLYYARNGRRVPEYFAVYRIGGNVRILVISLLVRVVLVNTSNGERNRWLTTYFRVRTSSSTTAFAYDCEANEVRNICHVATNIVLHRIDTFAAVNGRSRSVKHNDFENIVYGSP